MPSLHSLSKGLLVHVLDLSSDASVLELAAASRAVKTEVEECSASASEGPWATSGRYLENLGTLEISWSGRPQEDSICDPLLRSGVPECLRDAGLSESCQEPCSWHHRWSRDLQQIFVRASAYSLRACEWCPVLQIMWKCGDIFQRLQDQMLSWGHAFSFRRSPDPPDGFPWGVAGASMGLLQ